MQEVIPALDKAYGREVKEDPASADTENSSPGEMDPGTVQAKQSFQYPVDPSNHPRSTKSYKQKLSQKPAQL